MNVALTIVVLIVRGEIVVGRHYDVTFRGAGHFIINRIMYVIFSKSNEILRLLIVDFLYRGKRRGEDRGFICGVTNDMDEEGGGGAQRSLYLPHNAFFFRGVLHIEANLIIAYNRAI